MARIAVLGSTNVDLTVPVERRPGPGETVLAGDTRVSAGGKGANTAVAAARLGAEVALLSAVGSDPYGSMLTGALRESGVDVSDLDVHDGPSGIAYITVTPDGENTIVVSPGANRAVSGDYVARVAGTLTRSAVLATSLEIPADSVWQAMATAHDAGTRCVLGASPVLEPPADSLRRADPLLVNEHEAAWLLGSREPEPAKALLRLGARSAVVTLGARGVDVADANGAHRVAAPAVAAVDSTGAGDAFCGALSTRLALGDDLVTAAGYAVRVASIAVTRRGAQPSYPGRDEVPSG